MKKSTKPNKTKAHAKALVLAKFDNKKNRWTKKGHMEALNRSARARMGAK